jgi:hypothetical protein
MQEKTINDYARNLEKKNKILENELHKIKLCCFCQHMEFDHEKETGGCDTCGYGAEGRNDMVCTKGHWTTDIQYGLSTYREKIKIAQNCSDYIIATDEEK